MIVDSSVWLEIFRSGPLHLECERRLQKEKVKIPSVVLFEVYRKIKDKVSEDLALEAVATLSQHQLIPLEREIALLAADLSLEHQLAMADSLVLASAHFFAEPLLTLDNDFADLPGAVVIRTKK